MGNGIMQTLGQKIRLSSRPCQSSGITGGVLVASTLLEAWVVSSNSIDATPGQGGTDRSTHTMPRRWGQETGTILLKLWVDSDEENACFLKC